MENNATLMNLCCYDKRHPDYDHSGPTKHENCECPNCEARRTNLAETILKLQEIQSELMKTFRKYVPDSIAIVECKKIADKLNVPLKANVIHLDDGK